MRARQSEGYAPDFDLDLQFGKDGERRVAAFIEGMDDGTTEVKTDRQAIRTGNVWIEYECRDRNGVWRDSGIRTTEATYWAFLLDGLVIGVPTPVLRRVVTKALHPSLRMRSAEEDGSNPTSGVRIPLQLFLMWVRMELMRGEHSDDGARHRHPDEPRGVRRVDAEGRGGVREGARTHDGASLGLRPRQPPYPPATRTPPARGDGMSALRFSRPGIPGTVLIPLDDGATPRKSAHTFYLLGEATTTTPRTVMSLAQYDGRRCGYVMRVSGQPCFRPPHTGSDHRTEAQLDRAAARRPKRGK